MSKKKCYYKPRSINHKNSKYNIKIMLLNLLRNILIIFDKIQKKQIVT